MPVAHPPINFDNLVEIRHENIIPETSQARAVEQDRVPSNYCVNQLFNNMNGEVGMTSARLVSKDAYKAKVTIDTDKPYIAPGCSNVIKTVLSSANVSIPATGRVVSRSTYNFVRGQGVTLDAHKNRSFPVRFSRGLLGMNDTVTVIFQRNDGRLTRKTKNFAGQVDVN